ncbi:hypothetical protein COPR103792_05815 [Corynebacterium propinquum]
MPVELSVMRSSILAVLTGTTLLLGACSAPSDADDALKAAPEQATTGQNTAAETTTATEKTTATTYEFALEDYQVSPETHLPVRGSVTTAGHSNAPLVVVNHLRTFNCADDTFVYPCADGVDDVRADRGMHYLAEDLAEAGYTVVVPDLGPLWAPESPTQPYDQVEAWAGVVGAIRGELEAANQGQSQHLDDSLAGMTDFSRTGVFMHSRSALLGNKAAEMWPEVSLASYGGFYHVPEFPEDNFSPAPADVPTLTIDGQADEDTSQAAADWLPEYVGQDRNTAALNFIVSGLGHNYINRVLSQREFDDRIDDGEISDSGAAEHEEFLAEALRLWFDQTLRGQDGPYPLQADDELPAELAGREASVYAATPAAAEQWIASEPEAQLPGSEAEFCRIYPSMNPVQYDDRCDFVDMGIVNSASVNARVQLTKSPVVVPVSSAGAETLSMHMMPTGSREDGKKETKLEVTAIMDDGSRQQIPVPAPNPVLKDTTTETSNGEYWIRTLRISLPETVKNRPISQLEITGDGSIDLRAVDLY